MNTLLRMLAVLTSVSVLSGCVIAVGDGFGDDDDNRWRKRESSNKEAIGRLSMGQSVDSVVSNMGEPDISEAYERNGKEFRIYYYRTREVHSDNRTTKDEATPLVFMDGKLTGWGDAALEQTGN